MTLAWIIFWTGTFRDRTHNYDMTALPPILSDQLGAILRERPLAASALRAFGSPVHFLVPAALLRNVADYQAVFRRQGVRGRLFYASKVNRSAALLDAAALGDCGVEVSSLEELRSALGAGFAGARILVSGPLKSGRFLRLGLQHGCQIIVDDVSEIHALLGMTQCARGPIPLLLRMGGFTVTRKGRNEPTRPRTDQTRFGIPLTEFGVLLNLLASDPVRRQFDVLGLAFHLDNHSVHDRHLAFRESMLLLRQIRALGFAAQTIDIGGGFSARYVDVADWTGFHEEYLAALRRGDRGFMFRDKSFGIDFDGSQPLTRGNFYPHDTPVHGPAFLEELLAGSSAADPGIGEMLREAEIELWIEPGKSLVEQAGATLAEVRGVRAGNGEQAPMAVLGMNITHIYEQFIGSEFASDPILLEAGTQPASDARVFLHLAGNLCLENDILAWRQVPFRRMLTPGDILAFVNTAGYQMDFAESRIHRMNIAPRLAVTRGGSGWLWVVDGQYCGLQDEAAGEALSAPHSRS